MGKIGRIACIATPMAMTIVSLLLLIVVFMGGMNKNDENLSSLYYFKADTTHFKNNITSTGGFSTVLEKVNPDLRKTLTALVSSQRDSKLDDVYQIYLWNYCSGSNNSTGGVKLTKCSGRKANFWFNPVEVWNLNGTGAASVFPKEVQNGLNVYQKVSKWMFVAYVVALIATIANVIIGIFAVCSRWGSCATSIVASVACLFTFLAALSSTILFSTLTGAFNSVLGGYGIKLSVGTKVMSLDWLAFVFSLGASLFWTISSCCCSGSSSHSKNNKTRSGEKGGSAPFASRGYAPLNEGQGHEMGKVGKGGSSPYAGRETAYEPFRHS
ncbi:putative integral membrane protein [Venturia nashicola]|uniref:Putative integral membrane protein n=1 Tax=Venturia nashicola TaxID=86259 RepID=A0A4Z1NZV2_9PEZI|nr:putative integral membrane protein [Venturia nashicola]TLD18675.1 putative integral membrane protein [Venturia nashicola]